MSAPFLKAENLRKTRDGQPVLDDLSLELRAGEITAIVGPSGGGKSTLLRALSLVEKPDSGTLRIDGVPYLFPDAENPAPPWPKLTVVFQQFFLWPHLTLRENIALPLVSAGKSKEEIADLIAPLAQTFGMESFLSRHPNAVSGGQRQRAALARALALKPQCLLLDEITSALDLEQARILFDHLLTLREQGIALALVTHSLGFARAHADIVHFLDQGRLAETGGREILSTPQSDRLRQFLLS
ncbi:amino acid ABC transporter ATP-binding protein, PAAT family [Verrucomicrobium sp. GAS474]|uniref:ATP-binding cassette domain-containing protein n=1 Tax=Verrucomicrobium sp. GAS474 TaxID=1882831 RepID=UPI00087AD109|nr:ATP-binding cassette domain-containing protein [Verrucomicrobium sp. GAS474]SDU02476.1 amino acid ABC transporter ATP-binding protein, PAAT family [Verrucomicrobium sp. GAS474]